MSMCAMLKLGVSGSLRTLLGNCGFRIMDVCGGGMCKGSTYIYNQHVIAEVYVHLGYCEGVLWLLKPKAWCDITVPFSIFATREIIDRCYSVADGILNNEISAYCDVANVKLVISSVVFLMTDHCIINELSSGNAERLRDHCSPMAEDDCKRLEELLPKFTAVRSEVQK